MSTGSVANLFPNPLWQDIAATGITFAIALSWLQLMNVLSARQAIAQTLSRKLIHIGTGPLFVLCWLLFSDRAIAPYFAALVPLTITLQFLTIGLGWWSDPAAVKAMTRMGDPREILKGPLYYGLVFVVCTVTFWRSSPVGMLALMMMCGGDGLADIVGRRWGKYKLPFNVDKSWIGSTAMFLGSGCFGLSLLALFNGLGYFYPPLVWGDTIGTVVAIAAVVTLVEALPVKDIDNLTLTATAIGCGLLWL